MPCDPDSQHWHEHAVLGKSCEQSVGLHGKRQRFLWLEFVCFTWSKSCRLSRCCNEMGSAAMHAQQPAFHIFKASAFILVIMLLHA